MPRKGYQPCRQRAQGPRVPQVKTFFLYFYRVFLRKGRRMSPIEEILYTICKLFPCFFFTSLLWYRKLLLDQR